MYGGLVKIMEGLDKSYKETIIFREYHKFPKDSVEKGIFEKMPADKRVTIPADLAWEDAGTWELFFKTFKDSRENVLLGAEAELLESRGNLIIGPKGKMVGIIGLNNMVVIDTADGLLVTSLDKTSEVKKLFGALEKKKPKFVE
jgi:mannose-1-phosphate guanylyltransferase